MKLKEFIYNHFNILIVLLITFLLFFQVKDFQFLRWDDDQQIINNPQVKEFGLSSLFYNFKYELYTSLTLFFYSLLYKLFGLNPSAFHVFNLFIHLLNIVLFYIVFKGFFKRKNTLFLTLIIFAIHPMRIESVVWVSELKDLLFTFFALLSFYFYKKYLLHRYKWYYFLLVSFFAFLSSISKIQGLLVPFSLLLFDYYYDRKWYSFVFFEKVFLFLSIFFFFKYHKAILFLMLLFSLLSYYKHDLMKKKVLNVFFMILILLGIVSVFTYIFNKPTIFWSNEYNIHFSTIEKFSLAGYSIGFYLLKFIFPFPLNAVHIYPKIPLNSNFYFFILIIAVILIFTLFLIIKNNKFHKVFICGWFFFLLNISIVLHIIPIEGKLVFADRYTYFSYIGLIVIAGYYFENKFSMINFYIKFKNHIIFIISVFLFVASYLRINVWKDTSTLFTDVLQKNSNISFAHVNLATEFLSNGKTDSALYHLNKAIEIDSNDHTALFNRASIYITIKQHKNAYNDLIKIIQHGDVKYKYLSYITLGKEYEKQKHDSIALDLYSKAITLDSNMIYAYIQRGNLYIKANMLENAKKDFLKAYSIDSNNIELYNNLAWLYIQEGNYSLSEKYLKNISNQDKLNDFSYNIMGQVEMMKGNIELAINYFNNAIILNPNNFEAYLNRGFAYAKRGNFQEAINDFNYILSKIPYHQAALNNRAYAWLSLQEYQKAEQDFLKNVEIYPNHPFTIQNLAFYYMEIKNFPLAIKYFNQSLHIDSTLINSYINLAIIYLKTNKPKESEKYLQHALKFNPNNAIIYYWLGEVFRMRNDNENMCNYYQKSLSLGYTSAQGPIDSFCVK